MQQPLKVSPSFEAPQSSIFHRRHPILAAMVIKADVRTGQATKNLQITSVTVDLGHPILVLTCTVNDGYKLQVIAQMVTSPQATVCRPRPRHEVL